MSNTEEKIKAFLDDEKKVKALASDEVFIEKVIGGTATYETYGEEFKKLGLDLSDREPEKIKEAVDKIMSVPVEKLADGSLENVSGGELGTAGAAVGSAWLGALALESVGSLGCCIAAIVCNAKAHKAAKKGHNVAQKGHTQDVQKYTKAAKGLLIAAGSSAAAFAITGIAPLPLIQ